MRIFRRDFRQDFSEGFGEPARVRTVDLLIKSQLLYQLSYGLPNAGPNIRCW